MQFLVLSVLLSACMVAAGPLTKDKDLSPSSTLNADGEPSKRDKRSHVGAGSYSQSNSYAAANTYNAGGSYQGGGAPGYLAAPCGSAPIAIAPSGGYPIALPPALPAHGGYGYPSHISQYGGGGGGGYPQYRADDFYENEMSYSDMPAMEHVPMARSYGYDVVPAASQLSSASAYGGGAYGGGAYGPAVGVFPNANVGGCAVPLLLSCSPNVQAGKIIRQSHYGGAPAGYGSIAVAAGPAGGVAVSAGGGPGGYRDVDDHEQEMMQPSHHEDQHLSDDMPVNREKFPDSSEKTHHHHNHDEK